MRFLLATLDGAGSLQPLLALIEALVARGHEVHAIAHDVQQAPIETSGGRFIRYETALQLDQGDPARLDVPPEGQIALFLAFQQGSATDAMGAAKRLKPDAMLIDCLMPGALAASKHKGLKTIALMHAPYSFWCVFVNGLCRAPIDEADQALGFSYERFDVGTVFPPNLAFVGPGRPANGAAARWARLRPDKRLVLASLSSGIQGRAGVQVSLLQRICDALAGLDVEAVVTTGRGIDPTQLNVGSNTTIARRIPHEAVLAKADLFVTHAGHGSVMAAVDNGVPMLCLPPGADQPHNAAKVAELGLGEVLPITASSDEIQAAVARMLADRALRTRSAEFAGLVAEEPGIERAVELIEAIAT